MGGVRGGVRGWWAAVLCAATAPGCRERAKAVQSQGDLRLMVRQMMPAVERATGLAFKRDPVVAQRTRAQVREYVVHKFDDDLPAAELAGVQAAYRLFGLLPDTLDLRRTMIDLLTEQIAGYYDPDSNTLYIPADIDPFQLRIVVSHELVHALQDQYLDLDSVVQQQRQNDRRTAAQAVLEGQATLAQIVVLMPEQRLENLPDFQQMKEALRSQQNTMPTFARAPFWLRESLVFPYLGGADFVRWFTRTYPGRQPFGAAMPTSTEQVLHPERYREHDAPTALAFPAPAGEAVRYEDGLGEFETRLLLAQLLGDEAQAALLTTGWDGDRYQVVGPRADALVWYTVWDTPEAAVRFERGVRRAWPRQAHLGAHGRNTRIERVTLDGMQGVRLVDAPADWTGWQRVPEASVVR
ncbi:MAG: hypothetical protein ACREL9_10020 [Gemmatimonadales bacterium]